MSFFYPVRRFHPSLSLLVSTVMLLSIGRFNLAAAGKPPGLATRNVILVTTSGLRWQEVFGGAEAALMDATNGGVQNVGALVEQFGRGTPNLRRRALMPFLWNVFAVRGQLWGNTNRGSVVRVSNGFNLSYPGYNELLAGVADPRIQSDDRVPNPNATVLEWLNTKPAFQGKCAAFASWDVFPYILNRERSGLHVRAGFEPMHEGKINARQELLNTLIWETTPLYDGVLFDSFLMRGLLDYVREKKPRVLYVGFGETDAAADDGRYDRYLEAAQRVDRYLEELWGAIQSIRDYQNATTLIFTTDHGRGSGPVEWRFHGNDVAGSEDIWLAVMGPDTAAMGERSGTSMIYQNQVAATVAAFLGENFPATVPGAGEAIPGVMNKSGADSSRKP